MTFNLWFFTSISNQVFVCFYCQKTILFQNILGALEYLERMVRENVKGSILLLLPETFFVVGVVTWSLSGYLTGCFIVSHVKTCLFIEKRAFVFLSLL